MNCVELVMTRFEEKKDEKLEYHGPSLSSKSHPWLVRCFPRKTQTFFSISEDRCYERSIHELGNTIICACAQEWLVLEDFDSIDCYLWNAIFKRQNSVPTTSL